MIAREPPTRLVLLGHPVAHSLSPRMQGAALRERGLDVRYDAVDVTADALAKTIQALGADRAGGNVTLPHKEQMYALSRRPSALATRVGAVNTFWFDDGVLVGHNTDVSG